MNNVEKRPSFFASIIPVIVLIAIQANVIYHFGSDALAGPSQLGLLAAAAVSVLISVIFYRISYDRFEETVSESIGKISMPILLLLLIGALSGTWMVSGIVPYFIHAGLYLVSPLVFLPTACLLCAIVSVMTGSSWTTVATVGVALLGIGQANGFDEGWIAGAIISGAYFGDKMSPLSDTTVLASSATGTPLFTHIRYMFGTTIPSFLITLIIFGIASFMINKNGESDVNIYINGLEKTYNLSHWLLVVPAITIFLIYKKLPSIPVLFFSILMAVAIGLLVQQEAIDSLSEGNLFKDITQSIIGGTQIHTGNENLDTLLHTKGMAGMLDTVWLILCAMVFGSVMTASYMMGTIMEKIVSSAKKAWSLVATTVLSGIVLNGITGDQFLSIILSSSLFKDKYKEMNLETRLHSRSVEDGATVTSVLIPWTTCGMTQSTMLGVATITYLPYCFFNIISPLMSIFIAAFFLKTKNNDNKNC